MQVGFGPFWRRTYRPQHSCFMCEVDEVRILNEHSASIGGIAFLLVFWATSFNNSSDAFRCRDFLKASHDGPRTAEPRVSTMPLHLLTVVIVPFASSVHGYRSLSLAALGSRRRGLAASVEIFCVLIAHIGYSPALRVCLGFLPSVVSRSWGCNFKVSGISEGLTAAR